MQSWLIIGWTSIGMNGVDSVDTPFDIKTHLIINESLEPLDRVKTGKRAYWIQSVSFFL